MIEVPNELPSSSPPLPPACASNGIELAGPSGTLTKDGITARYEHAEGKLRIEIVDKPFLLPTSLIEGRLQSYLEQSLASGNVPGSTASA